MTQDARIKLATQGDDLGSSHSANKAIAEAYRNGILRNTSIMVICPEIKEAAEMLASEKGLCFGLHSSMNAEWDTVKWGPVLPPERVPSLVDGDGNLFQTTVQLFQNNPSVDEVMAELQAQLVYARELGFEISYVDAHCGWTWILKDDEARFHEWVESNGLKRRGRYERLPDVAIDGDPVEKLIARLSSAEPGQYAVGGHPSYDNEEMRALGHDGYPGDKVATEREWERRIFTDQRILTYCAENGVVPIRHDEAE
jgi:hypothetical protein